MTDAISRSEAMNALNQHSYETAYDWEATLDILEELPALDVEPVVRCKDCRRSRMLSIKEMITFEPYCLVCCNPHGAGVSYPEYDMTEKVVLPDNYCSYGKRRENGR